MNVNLVRFRKNGSPVSFDLHDGLVLIGRSSKCRLRIPIKSVSRKHCQIQIEGNKIHISDLGSRNGTLINNSPILEPCAIKAGDNLQIGPVKFTFQVNGKPDLTKPISPQEEIKKQSAPPAEQKVSSVKPTPPSTPKSVKPVQQAPAEEKREDTEDDLGFLDEEFMFDKDVDSLGSSASSLH